MFNIEGNIIKGFKPEYYSGGDTFHVNRYNELTIPEGIEIINSNAFMNLTNLEKINFPSSLTHIYENAFYNCEKLKSISIKGNNLEYIGSSAFQYCTSLEDVYLEFKQYPENTKFSTIVNNYSLTTTSEETKKIFIIRNGAFDNCYSLERLYINNRNVLFTNAFDGNNLFTNLYKKIASSEISADDLNFIDVSNYLYENKLDKLILLILDKIISYEDIKELLDEESNLIIKKELFGFINGVNYGV